MAAERRRTQKRQLLDGKTISINGNTCRPGIIALPVALSIDRQQPRLFHISRENDTHKKMDFCHSHQSGGGGRDKIVPCHTDQPLRGGIKWGGNLRLCNDSG